MLTDVDVPDDALIGDEGAGFRVVMRNFDFTRPLLALTAIGCAQASLDETVEHARHREVFGSTLSPVRGNLLPAGRAHDAPRDGSADLLPRAVEADQRPAAHRGRGDGEVARPPGSQPRHP